MKIARFKRLGEHSFETIGTEDGIGGIKHYVRLSEYVDVEFPPLQDQAVIEKHIEALDAAESEVRARFQQTLNEIERQRQELRAITYRPASE